MRSVLIAFLIAVSSAAFAEGADVGLVNFVTGDVTYAPPSGSPAKVQVFMKLRERDRIDITAGGQVRVLYFESGRQERWFGPASFRVGRTEAVPISGKFAESVVLPAGAPQRIAQVPQLVQIAKLGGIQVRGLTHVQKASLEQQEAVAKARATYKTMRDELAPDDISPELYLYAVLYEYLLYDDMKTVVEEMRRKQPDNEDVKTLEAWVVTKASR